MKDLKIRKLNSEDTIPYQLLLLSDDAVEAIDKNLIGSTIYVALRDNETVASFIVRDTSPDEAEIMNIAVLEKYQGKGIGSALIEYISKDCKSRKIKTLIVGTCDCCFKEIEFYKKTGFIVVARRENFFLENYDKPIFENGTQLKDMIMLSRTLT